jgi:hypothetical protein
MPAQPQWICRIPEILGELSLLDVPVVDRGVIERLFGLRRRRAISLLHALGGFQSGRHFLAETGVVVRKLEAIQGGEQFHYEKRRRRRLAEALAEARRRQAGREVVLPAPGVSGGSVPPGVRLGKGRLEVEFETPEELLGRLFEVARLASEDFETFRALLARAP